QEVKPQYYKLVSDDSETEVCLATGFTRHNATEGSMPEGTEASQITKDEKPTGVYNQVAFLESDKNCGGEPEGVEPSSSYRHDIVSRYNYQNRINDQLLCLFNRQQHK
ncbi:hypothetical protein AMECASPLE_007779, partial [Ameca splendens]